MAGFGDKNSWEVEGPAAAPAQAPKAIQPDPGFHERGPSLQAIAHEPGHNERGPSRQAIAHEKGPYVSPHNKPKPFSHRAGNHHPQRNGAHAKTGKRSNPAAQAQKQNPVLLPDSAQEAARRAQHGAPKDYSVQQGVQSDKLPPNLVDDQIENGIVMQGMRDYASKRQFHVNRFPMSQTQTSPASPTAPHRNNYASLPDALSALNVCVAQEVQPTLDHRLSTKNKGDLEAVKSKCGAQWAQVNSL